MECHRSSDADIRYHLPFNGPLSRERAPPPCNALAIRIAGQIRRMGAAAVARHGT